MKLVRDGYVSIIPEEELDIITCPIKLKYLLYSKLEEEVRELAESDFKDPSEYGDILEVLNAIAQLADVEWSTIRAVKFEKRLKLGGFKTGLLWHPEEDR